MLYRSVPANSVCCRQQIHQENDSARLHPLHRMTHRPHRLLLTSPLLHPGTDALVDIWHAKKRTVENVKVDR